MFTNRQLALPYTAPYLAYVAIASLSAGTLSPEVSYSLRLVIVTLLLRWSWRWYCPLTGPDSPWMSALWGVAAGLIGIAVWIGLLTPLAESGAALPWSTTAFLLRLTAAGLLVPLFEELLMRGFIFRLALQWDQSRQQGVKKAFHTALDHHSINRVKPGEWSWFAIALSTAAFTAGHQLAEWPASIAFGLLMTLLWIRRRDLLSCIVAHATANIALAGYIYATGSWHLW